jgi:hypothetical protein
MNNTMREVFQILKDEQTLKRSALKEEIQNVTGSNYGQETSLVNGSAMPSIGGGMGVNDMSLDDPNLLLDPALNFEMNNLEQKKTMLIDYFDKLINKIVIVRDHIDSLSFDSVVSSNTFIGASQLQFNLEELKSKVSKYIEEQYDSDKYERSLYVYLSFMEELKLIVKLLQKQARKI